MLRAKTEQQLCNRKWCHKSVDHRYTKFRQVVPPPPVLKGEKKRFTSIISINQLATWASTPEAHGISAHWTHKISKPFKVFFIRLHLKTTVKHGVVQLRQLRRVDRSRRRKRSHKSAYDLENIQKIISATETESEESERFHILPTPSPTFRLWSSENQIVGVGKRRGRINQSLCTFPRFVIGLVLPFLLASPTTKFSLNRNDGVVSGIRTLFSLDRKVLRFWLRLRLRLRR